jgi:PAS domain S-box-containing protein
MNGLERMGGDLHTALNDVRVPAYAIDPSGVIRWVNPAAERLVGDVRGRRLSSVVAPEERLRAQEAFARKIVGNEKRTDAEVMVVGADGERVLCDISSVPLMEGHKIVGVFGQVVDIEEEDDRPPLPALTPRQHEILRMLERGRSTEQIARELHLSTETVRNHVRRLLRALGVHSRLEAVAMARTAAA